MCEGKESFLMLDFVGNSEFFNEGYSVRAEWASGTEWDGKKRDKRGGGLEGLRT